MEIGGIICGIALVATAALVIAANIKRNQIQSQLQKLQNPPVIETAKTVGEAVRLVRGVLKNQTFRSRQWSIKEDNPNGMLIAFLAFDEDIAKQAGLAKRQLVLTVSVTAPNHVTTVALNFSVYSTFGTLTSDAILQETTSAIEQALR